MLKSAGGQGKPTVFLLTDSQIKEESFLEDVDSLLNTGEVPNLFAVDEKAELIEVSETFLNALPEKCAYSEVRIFPHSDWIRRDTEYLSVFSPNSGKYRPE